MNSPTFYPSEEFLEVRKQGIGASDVPAICGVSQYGTPLSVFCEKTGRMTVEDNAAMRRGRRYEPLILEEFKDEFDISDHHLLTSNKEHANSKMIWRHDKYKWAFCHPDAVIVDKNFDPTALIQAKFTSIYKGWGTMALGEVPEAVQYQVQWEMFCSGLSVDYVPVLMGNRDFRIYHCKAIPELQNEIFKIVSVFKKDYLDKDIMPEPTGTEADTKAIKSLLPQSQEKEAQATAKLIEMVKELKIFKQELNIAEELHNEVANRIKVEMGDAEVLHIDDCKIRFKTQERKVFDYKRLCKDSGFDLIPEESLEPYRKVTTSRPFVPKWKDENSE